MVELHSFKKTVKWKKNRRIARRVTFHGCSHRLVRVRTLATTTGLGVPVPMASRCPFVRVTVTRRPPRWAHRKRSSVPHGRPWKRRENGCSPICRTATGRIKEAANDPFGVRARVRCESVEAPGGARG